MARTTQQFTVSVGTSGATLSNAELMALGYIPVTASPYDADPTGNDDATSAIQAAIDAAYAAEKTVWIPAGTYKISDTLRCYRWQSSSSGSPPSTHHNIEGASYPSRPLLKLAATAPGFDSPGTPKAMLVFAQWKPTSGSLAPPTDVSSWNPLTTSPPGGPWSTNTPNLFNQSLTSVNFDTNGHAGAEGLFMATAQNSHLSDVKITATGSRCGWRGIPGRDSCSRNIEVVGGQVGVSQDPLIISGSAGGMIVGLTCTDQTVSNLEARDFVPLVVTGFHFKKAAGGPAVTFGQTSATNGGAAVLIDGRVETASGVAFDNTTPVGLYLCNVYVGGGTTSLVKTSATTLSGSGAWSRIDEYCANRFGGTYVAPGTAGTDSTSLQHFELRDGVTTRQQIPEASATSNSGPPPQNIVSRHIYGPLPRIDGGPFINVTAAPYNAVATVGVDNRAAIQAAIDAAAAAGHNRVFLPKGTFEIGAPGIILGADTKLFGMGLGDRSTLYTHASWTPPDGSTPPIVSTVDSASGTAYLGFLTIHCRDSGSARTHFNSLRWQVGRFSATACLSLNRDYVSPTNLVSLTPQIRMWITGNGGGRHYGYNTETIGLGGADSRGLKISDTTGEPIHVYGVNSESVKRALEDATTGYMRTNIEITNADNVRLYSMKREGSAPTCIITDCRNVALYAGGGFMETHQDNNQVLGSSSGILIAMILTQAHNATASGTNVYEDVAGGGGSFSIGWPNGVSLYKRGILDTAAVVI